MALKPPERTCCKPGLKFQSPEPTCCRPGLKFQSPERTCCKPGVKFKSPEWTRYRGERSMQEAIRWYRGPVRLCARPVRDRPPTGHTSPAPGAALSRPGTLVMPSDSPLETERSREDASPFTIAVHRSGAIARRYRPMLPRFQTLWPLVTDRAAVIQHCLRSKQHLVGSEQRQPPSLHAPGTPGTTDPLR